MLNKELLMGSKQGQRKVVLTIGKMSGIVNGGVYGCNILFGFGSLDALPYWETPDARGLDLWYSEPYGKTYCQTISGVMIFVEGYPQSIFNDVELDGDPYSMAGEVGGIRYLTFDPPPRRVLGSRNTQTDLRRGYYVEEAHWEAQDAE